MDTTRQYKIGNTPQINRSDLQLPQSIGIVPRELEGKIESPGKRNRELLLENLKSLFNQYIYNQETGTPFPSGLLAQLGAAESATQAIKAGKLPTPASILEQPYTKVASNLAMALSEGGGSVADDLKAKAKMQPQLKAVQPLLEEARKYKSAEEFVRDKMKYKVEQVRVDSLPERATSIGMSKDRFDYLAKDIQENGIRNPIIIGKDSGDVLDGMHRAFVAKELGLETIPAIRMKPSSLDEARSISNNWSRNKAQLTDIWNEAQGIKPLTEAIGMAKVRPPITSEQLIEVKPILNLKRDVPATDIYGVKKVIPEGEALTTYELKGNKILLKDGDEYIVNKNQYQNIKGNSISTEAKPFAPELEGLEESIRSEKGKIDHQAKVESIRNQARADFDAGKITLEERNTILYNADKYIPGINPQYNRIDLVLPGGENYREILIKAPIKPKMTLEEYFTPGNIVRGYSGKDKVIAFHPDTGQGWSVDVAAIKRDGTLGGIRTHSTYPYYELSDEPIYRTNHWEELNVLAHIRMNDRTYKGKKVAFMEELQSDWAREGREKGFAKTITELPKGEFSFEQGLNGKIEVYKDGFMYGEGNTFEQAKQSVLRKLNEGIPNHPFLKNWQEPTIKRALKDAVENDAEYFAWINGAQTSERYNLATYVDNVKWDKSQVYENGKYVKIVPKEGGKNLTPIDIEVGKDGVIKKSFQESDWEGRKLNEVLPKGLGDKIMEKKSGTLSGEGLKFGGEWADNLYDRQVKNIVEDLTGGKVEMIDVSTGEKRYALYDKETGGLLARDYSLQEAKEIVAIEPRMEYKLVGGGKSKQQAIRLTPEIKAKIRGEAPPLKQPSGVSPFEIVNRALEKRGVK